MANSPVCSLVKTMKKERYAIATASRLEKVVRGGGSEEEGEERRTRGGR